jgi:adenylylsulfate kinase
MNLKPGTVWITGLSCSGKTTLGQRLYDDLRGKGVRKIEFLDGEDMRERLDRVYGHSLEERYLVLSKVVEIVRECNEKGNIAIVSTVSHQRRAREIARKEIEHFMEVYLSCPVETCADRDYKGHYKRALNDRTEFFPGITEPYEVSESPQLVLDTSSLSVEECSAALLEHVEKFLSNRHPHVESTSRS